MLNKEAEFQQLIAHEIAMAPEPMEYIRNYQDNPTMVKISLICAGETVGISSTGEVFSEEGLDFSAGGTVNGLELSESYVNFMGTWAYTMKCPVERGGKKIASLYIEYVYDSLDQSCQTDFTTSGRCSTSWMRTVSGWCSNRKGWGAQCGTPESG